MIARVERLDLRRSPTTTRWRALDRERGRCPAAPRSGGDSATRAHRVHAELVGRGRRGPRPSARSISPSRPAGARASGLTSTYGGRGPVRPATAVRSASTSSRQAGFGRGRAARRSSPVARRWWSGTAGAAASPATTPAMSSTSAADRSTVPSGWSAVGAPTSATTATPRDGASSPASGGTMRWVTSEASGVAAGVLGDQLHRVDALGAERTRRWPGRATGQPAGAVGLRRERRTAPSRWRRPRCAAPRPPSTGPAPSATGPAGGRRCARCRRPGRPVSRRRTTKVPPGGDDRGLGDQLDLGGRTARGRRRAASLGAGQREEDEWRRATAATPSARRGSRHYEASPRAGAARPARRAGGGSRAARRGAPRRRCPPGCSPAPPWPPSGAASAARRRRARRRSPHPARAGRRRGAGGSRGARPAR